MEEKDFDALRDSVREAGRILRAEAEPSCEFPCATAGMAKDRLFYWIGKFVVEFQAIEYELRSILWFCDDKGFGWKSFGKTLQAAKSKIAMRFDVAHAPDDARRRATDVLDRCHALAEQRNELIHSAFVQHESMRGNETISVAYSHSRGTNKPGYAKRALTEPELEQKSAEARELHEELFKLHRYLMYGLGSS
jgi:hypothetical protein